MRGRCITPRGGGWGSVFLKGPATLLLCVEDLHKGLGGESSSWLRLGALMAVSSQAAAGWGRRKWPGHREQTLAGP